MCHHKSLNIAIVNQMSRLGQSSKWAKLCILHRMQYSLQLKLQENRNTSKQDFRSGWSASLTTNRFHFTSYKDGFSLRFNCLGDRIWYQTSWHIVDTNLGHDTNWCELDYIEFNYIQLYFTEFFTEFRTFSFSRPEISTLNHWGPSPRIFIEPLKHWPLVLSKGFHPASPSIMDVCFQLFSWDWYRLTDIDWACLHIT